MRRDFAREQSAGTMQTPWRKEVSREYPSISVVTGKALLERVNADLLLRGELVFLATCG
jgi:hypothetical protein